MTEDHGYDFEPDEPDEPEEDEDFDCGEDSDGRCRYAGTEWCDFECPFHDEVFGLTRHEP